MSNNAAVVNSPHQSPESTDGHTDKMAGLPITADCTGIGGIARQWPESAPSSGIGTYQVQLKHVSTVFGFAIGDYLVWVGWCESVGNVGDTRHVVTA